MRGTADLCVQAGGVVALARDMACGWSGEVMTDPIESGKATGADVPTLARGRLVSGGRP